MTEDLYKTLGVDKDASATEIKKGYRNKAKEHHPDKGGDSEIFNNVSYAYNILSDKDKKEKYDKYGHDGLSNTQRSHASAFEEMIRQQDIQRERERFMVIANLTLSVEEIYNGVKKTISYNRNIKCEPCDGNGGFEPTTCTTCNGSGRMGVIRRTPIGTIQEFISCTRCSGKGKTYAKGCNACHSSGTKVKREKTEITIPKGLLNNNHLIKGGMGNVMPNGEFSDLAISLRLDNSGKYVMISEYDIETIIKIPYYKLALGGDVEFKTIDGKTLKVPIKRLSEVGVKLRLKGKGMPIRNTGRRGNQYLKVELEMPSMLSQEEEELLKSLEKLNK